MTIWRYPAWATVLACLTVACWQDKRTKTVTRFLWWIGGAAAWILLWLQPEYLRLRLPEFLLYYALQHLWFARFYGRADCRAYCLCALSLVSLGGGLKAFLLHMLLSFSMLAVVQALGGNIRTDGNLRIPVAFLPYITIAYLPLLWYYYT